MTLSFGYVDPRGGGRIFYAAERGEGTPLLIAHPLFQPGASTTMHFDPGLAFNRELADGASWYMYDYRNSGQSSRSDEPPTFDSLVNDLEAVAGLIGQPFDVYGRIQGGALAVALAARRPELVRRLLLVSLLRIQADPARLPEYAQLTQRRFRTDPEGTLASYLAWQHPGSNPALLLEVAKKQMQAMPLDAGRPLWQALKGVDLRDVGHGVQAPALFLTQEHELDLAAEAADCLPDARVANWNRIGDGTVNGATWRRAWDELIPPRECGQLVALCTDREPVAALTPRETAVFALLCRGLSNAEIADSLVIAPGTAKRHVANIFAKLGVSSRPQAMALAHERGIVP